MSYTLYVDREEIFEAKIKISGASLSQSFCRLVIESADWNLVFNGEIDSAGKCNIPIKKLKGIIPEGVKGTMKLEVIAEDTYFVPWTSEFEVEVAKSVNVEVVQKSKKIIEKVTATAEIIIKKKRKPIVEKKKVSIKKRSTQIPVDLKATSKRVHLKEFTKTLIKEGITYKNITSKSDTINSLGYKLAKEHMLSESTMQWILKNTFKLLKIKDSK